MKWFDTLPDVIMPCEYGMKSTCECKDSPLDCWRLNILTLQIERIIENPFEDI